MRQIFSRLKGKQVLIVFTDGEKLEGRVLSSDEGGAEIQGTITDPVTKTTKLAVFFINTATVKTVRAL